MKNTTLRKEIESLLRKYKGSLYSQKYEDAFVDKLVELVEREKEEKTYYSVPIDCLKNLSNAIDNLNEALFKDRKLKLKRAEKNL